MLTRGRTLTSIEKVQTALVFACVGAASVVVLGGMLGTSWAWTDHPNGTGEGWTDGVKPWALWAFFGGLAVVGLLIAGRWRGERFWVLAGAGALMLWHAGNEAAEYRARVENGMLMNYEEGHLSFGLRVVPTVAPVGAVVVGALAAVTLGQLLHGRYRSRRE